MEKYFILKPGARFIHNESGAEYTYYFSNAIRPIIRTPTKSRAPSSITSCSKSLRSLERGLFRYQTESPRRCLP